VALVVVATPSVAHAETWPEVAPRVARALDGVVEPATAKVLLARPDVRAALMDALRSHDGQDDALVASRRADGAVILNIVVRARNAVCIIPPGSSEAPSVPGCTEQLTVSQRQTVVLEEGLWKTPLVPKRKPPTRGKPKRLASVARTPPKTAVPRLPSVMDNWRAQDSDDAFSSPVATLIADYDAFKTSLKERRWTDPMLPPRAVDAGEALIPLPSFEPQLEDAVTANLRNPFGPGRMETAIPVPHQITLSRDVYEEATVKPVFEDCQRAWDAGSASPKALSLECVKRIAHNARLNQNDFYKVVKDLSWLVDLIPVVNDAIRVAMQSIERDAASHLAFNAVWVALWLDWVRQNPTEVSVAVASLGTVERRVLRRRLWRWWVRPQLSPYRATISHLYERHFLGLYPEATDLGGLPKRSFFNDSWLWASNWLTTVGTRPPAAIEAAYRGLGPREQGIIDAIVSDDVIAHRFGSSSHVLRAL
jgi:hypothetical protein